MDLMTWITRLCTLCTMSALMQIALPDSCDRGSVRMICGLLMLRITVERVCEIAALLAQQTELTGIFSCMMS